ncbi:MAG: FmdE family protein, partial [Thermodesulfobacteriota bacterium]
MAGCKLTQNQIDQVVNFHGHWCPGLAIGLRAGEYVLDNFGRAADEEIVALVETDMCAVDADQEDPAKVLAQATGGKMADVVMDVSGHPSGAGQALALAGLGAT